MCTETCAASKSSAGKLKSVVFTPTGALQLIASIWIIFKSTLPDVRETPEIVSFNVLNTIAALSGSLAVTPKKYSKLASKTGSISAML